MQTPETQSLSARYTRLSDRFRSLWTFYQFLGGVLKHLGEGTMPYSYDFQALHRRLEDLVHTIGIESPVNAAPELDQLERELNRIQREMDRIESQFAPSTMRKFFDHIKRQDEKVLSALLKFYLISSQFEQDTLDKLDILFTRIAEEVGEDGRITVKDTNDLLVSFKHLTTFIELPPLPAAEQAPLIDAVNAIREELESIEDYPSLVESKVYERYRSLKQRLGKTAMHPSILKEIVVTNIEAKNRFKDLYEAEERKVVENTNRIFEIERYLENHPELASEELKRQLEEFRTIRVRYEARARKDNVKRDDIAEMTRAMQAVLAKFDPASKRTIMADAEGAPVSTTARTASHKIIPPDDPEPGPDETSPTRQPDETSLSEILPPDPLLNETLHKIMFALEMIVWDRLPSQIATAPEIRNLNLEPREIETYRKLAEAKVEKGTSEWELDRFFLTSAALRVKMEEERNEITRLENANNSDRLFEVLEHSARSLDRARDTDRRFQWYIDDMLFRGDTQQLETVYRSRFRFLHAYSALWLAHQKAGGLTPL